MLEEIELIAFNYYVEWKISRVHLCSICNYATENSACCKNIHWGEQVGGSNLFFNGSCAVSRWYFDFKIWQSHPYSGLWIPAYYWSRWTDRVSFVPWPFYKELIHNITVVTHSKHNDLIKILYTYFVGPFGRCIIILDMFIGKKFIDINIESFKKMFVAGRLNGYIHSRVCILKKSFNGEVIYVQFQF